MFWMAKGMQKGFIFLKDVHSASTAVENVSMPPMAVPARGEKAAHFAGVAGECHPAPERAVQRVPASCGRHCMKVLKCSITCPTCP